MRKKILAYSLVIILLSVVVTSVVSVSIWLESHLRGQEEAMFAFCRVLGNEVSAGAFVSNADGAFDVTPSGTAGIANFARDTGYRVTLIAEDGTVLADSEAGAGFREMENHLDRQEISDALSSGQGIGRHISHTFGNAFLYVASLESCEGKPIVVRLAAEVDRISVMRDQTVTAAALSALIGLVLGCLFALLYTRRLTRPIREMEEQLVVTMEENTNAENIRREFVANVTHELKTPLTSISGFAETLQGRAGGDPEARAKFLEIILVEAVRLARLIDDILVISDIESGRETMRDSDLNVKQALEDVVESLRPLAAGAGIELHFYAEYEIYIGGDVDRFKAMMVNLVENAVKYSGRGKNVYIETRKVLRGGRDAVLVSIRDEGIGIAEEHMPRLFERFYRVDKSRSREAGGTGLGLAIVKHIAALFDAEVAVVSAVGAGSTFTVWFPV
jgi:two-component system phosphate regulon sensor histidine kinase PhoR